MDTTSVPLWVLVLPAVTGLVAVILTPLTVALTNRNAAKIAAAQDEHSLRMLQESHKKDRQVWLDDHRVATYLDALEAVQTAALDLESHNVTEDTELNLSRSANRVAMLGSAEATKAISSFVDIWYLEHRNPAHTKDTTRLAEASGQFTFAAKKDIAHVGAEHQVEALKSTVDTLLRRKK